MTGNSEGLSCPAKSWILGAVVGIIAALLMRFVGTYGWGSAIFVGILLFVLIGLLLVWFRCEASDDAIAAKASNLATEATGTTEDAVAASAAVAPKPAATPAAKAAEKPVATPAAKAAEKPVATPAAKAAEKPVAKVAAKPAAVENADGETKPVTLTAARETGADDLKVIKGVGPGLEKTLNEMGFYHYDQIAKWGEGEIAWVDARLKFKGRIVRDNWVDQAAELAK